MDLSVIADRWIREISGFSDDPCALFSPKEREEIMATYSDFKESLPESYNDDSLRVIEKSFFYALYAHGDAKRKSGTPFILHPIRVAKIVACDIGLDLDSIVASLLHDVVEDTFVSLHKIRKEFGGKVAFLVGSLTKVEKLTGTKGSSLQIINLEKLITTTSQDIRVFLIKFSDKLDNMLESGVIPRYKQMKICAETERIYIPIAYYLGLTRLRNKLEDVYLKVVYPKEYKEIHERVQRVYDDSCYYIDPFLEVIESALKKERIQYRIQKRKKTKYSIWKKIEKKKYPFEKIHDVIALRIIVDVKTEEEQNTCWKIYSLIVNSYTPHPRRLRDWITTPKKNGYQSLHLSIMTPQGCWLEVQIRTERMHERAEKGVAAHWLYKTEREKISPFLKKWMLNMQSILRKSLPKSSNLLEQLPISTQKDDVQIFDKRGRMFLLPEGSSVIDFSIEIYGKKGLRVKRAWINKEEKSLQTILKSGDQIELLLGNKSQLTEDWLTFSTSLNAKNIIEQEIEKKEKEWKLEGKKKIKKFFRKLQIPMHSKSLSRFAAFCEEPLEILFRKVAMDDISYHRFIEFQKEAYSFRYIEKNNKHSQLQIFSHETLSKCQHYKPYKLSKGNYLLAKCCCPVIDEEIFIIRSENEPAIVHTFLCSKANHLLATESSRICKGRWIYKSVLSRVTLTIIFNQSKSIMKKILTHTNMYQVESIYFAINKKEVECNLVISVENISPLEFFLRQIKHIKGILSVKRVSSEIVSQ